MLSMAFLLTFLILIPLIIFVHALNNSAYKLNSDWMQKNSWRMLLFVFYFVFVLILAIIFHFIDSLDKWTFFLIVLLAIIPIFGLADKITLKYKDVEFEVIKSPDDQINSFESKNLGPNTIQGKSKNTCNSTKRINIEKYGLDLFLRSKSIYASEFLSDVKILTKDGLGINKFDGYYKRRSFSHFVEVKTFNPELLNSGLIEFLLMEIQPFSKNKVKKADLTVVIILGSSDENIIEFMNEFYQKYSTQLRNELLHIETIYIPDNEFISEL